MVLTGSTLLNASKSTPLNAFQHRSTSAVHVTEIIRRSHIQDERMRAAKNEKMAMTLTPPLTVNPTAWKKSVACSKRRR
jgi:hypothetical protein